MSAPSSSDTPPLDDASSRPHEAIYAAARQVLTERLRRLEGVGVASEAHTLRRSLLTALPDALATGIVTQVESIAFQLGVLGRRQGIPLAAVVANAHHNHNDTMDAIIAHIAHVDHAGLVALLQVSHVLRDLTDVVLSGYQDEAMSSLMEQALTDALTGIANRRAFDARLDDELRRAERFSHPVAVILLDIDGLKQMNDAHGHTHGDILLCTVATVLREQARGIDLVARIGGDEFVAILPESDQGAASALVQRLAQAVGGRQVEDIPVRFSAGVAVYPGDGTSAPVLMNQADHRMYAAKRHRGDNAPGSSP